MTQLRCFQVRASLNSKIVYHHRPIGFSNFWFNVDTRIDAESHVAEERPCEEEIGAVEAAKTEVKIPLGDGEEVS